MKKIALLGSTGSIGKQTLEVVDRYPDKFKITALAANGNYAELEKQIWRYKPDIAVLSNPEYANKITSLPKETSFYYGENALLHAAAADVDLVFVAVSGFSGLKAVVCAIENGKDVAIANKESLVAGGELVTRLAKEKGVRLIPVDSEHSAIWQALDFDTDKQFEKLIITASGGAFRDYDLQSLKTVTAAEALMHPNWKMGAKITVDCATMVNKGFEVAEAKWLFNTEIDKIDVVIHRESIIHSMVQFQGGAVLAQMGIPDMKVPISLALTYPERLDVGVKPLDFSNLNLTFTKPNFERYPCFPLVIEAIRAGKNYPCALSAANEVAVNLFLNGKIGYTEIYDYLRQSLDETKETTTDLEGLIYTDKTARSRAIGRFKANLTNN